jgi:streptogramin lyase
LPPQFAAEFRSALGQLVRVDPKTGAKKMAAQLKPSLDNLAIDDKDRIFVSNMADNGIQEVDSETGAAKQIIIGKLALPGGIAVVSDAARTRSTSPMCSPIA